MPKCFNICHQEAEKIVRLPKSVVLISISEEDRSEWNLKVSGEQVLRLRFSDVRAVTIHKGKTYNPMTADDAQKIIDFIEKNKDKDIIINCAAGIARSAACCLFAHLFFNYELKQDFWKLSLPNPVCVGMLINQYYLEV